MIRRLLSQMRRFGQAVRREDGTATAEFVIVFPVLMMILFQALEAGWIEVRQTMLDRALDLTVRELRLGHFTNPTNATLRQAICDQTAGVISNCTADMLVELTPVDTTTWTMPSPQATCVDRSAKIQPVTTVLQGASDQMMIVRACVIVDLLFPTTGLGLDLPQDGQGGIQLVSSSAFVNEPS